MSLRKGLGLHLDLVLHQVEEAGISLRVRAVSIVLARVSVFTVISAAMKVGLCESRCHFVSFLCDPFQRPQ